MNINLKTLDALPRSQVRRVLRILNERDRDMREIAAIKVRLQPGRKAKD